MRPPASTSPVVRNRRSVPQQVGVRRLGVAQLELDRAPDLDDVTDGDRTAFLVGPDEPADEEVAVPVLLDVFVHRDADLQAGHGEELVVGVEAGDDLAQLLERGPTGEAEQHVALGRGHRHRRADRSAALAHQRRRRWRRPRAARRPRRGRRPGRRGAAACRRRRSSPVATPPTSGSPGRVALLRVTKPSTGNVHASASRIPTVASSIGGIPTTDMDVSVRSTSRWKDRSRQVRRDATHTLTAGSCSTAWPAPITPWPGSRRPWRPGARRPGRARARRPRPRRRSRRRTPGRAGPAERDQASVHGEVARPGLGPDREAVPARSTTDPIQPHSRPARCLMRARDQSRRTFVSGHP